MHQPGWMGNAFDTAAYLKVLLRRKVRCHHHYCDFNTNTNYYNDYSVVTPAGGRAT